MKKAWELDETAEAIINYIAVTKNVSAGGVLSESIALLDIIFRQIEAGNNIIIANKLNKPLKKLLLNI